MDSPRQDSNNTVLARIDERVASLTSRVEKFEVVLAKLEGTYVEKMDLLRKDLTERYVNHDVFRSEIENIHERYEPVRKLCYGLVGLFLTAIITALISFVIGTSNIKFQNNAKESSALVKTE